MEKFTWKCVKPLFLKYFSLFKQLYIAKVPLIGSGSGENFPDPAPDPQPCLQGMTEILAEYGTYRTINAVLRNRDRKRKRKLEKRKKLHHFTGTKSNL